MTDLHSRLFGFIEDDLDRLANRLSVDFSLQFEGRSSDYWGEYYIDRSNRYEECRLYKNEDPLFCSASSPPEEFWFEPDYREYVSLLSVYGLQESIDDFQRLLQSKFPESKLLFDKR
ncbi:MAG: hypothetical protein COA78_02950 [Blastopirellula sp.]|nr:MAG: hypothetical protein COA78_02950 [Blastopirellula sp.]